MSFKKHPLLALPIIGIIAGAGVLTFAEHRTGRIDGYAFNSLDSREYYQIALNLARHGSFSQGESEPYEPDTWRTPGYPLFLAIHLLPQGNSSVELILVQQLLNLVNALLLAFIAQKYMSERRALLVGLLFVIEPYHHWYSLWLMPTTLFLTVLLLIWHVWRRATRSGRWYWFALLGGLLGFVVLIRPLGLLLPVVVLGGMVVAWLARPENSKAMFKAFGVTLACVIVVIGVWTGRNKVVAGHFALSHQSGVVLAYFKATEVMLWRLGRTAYRYEETSLDPKDAALPHEVWDDIDTRLRNRFSHLPAEQLNQLQWAALAQGNKTELDSFELSAVLRSIGLEMLLEEPLSTLGCCFVRCFSILTFPLNLVLKPPAEPHNPGTLKAPAQSRRTSGAAPAVGGAYLALFLCVLFRLLGGGLSLRQIYFPLACTIALLLVSTPQFDPRLRVPMIPMLLFIALLPRQKNNAAKEHPH